MKNSSFILSSCKVLLLSTYLGWLITIGVHNGSSLTGAFFSAVVTSSANLLQAGYWAPDSPENLGWNIPSLSSQPGERPVDLACGAITNGANPTSPKVAQNWTVVSGINVMYQREVTYPSGQVKSSFYNNENHTPFVALGSPSGIEGLWKMRVRAFEDVNGNGSFEDGIDKASDWSNVCAVTLDTTSPQISFTNLPVSPSISNSNSFTIKASMADLHLSAYQVKIFASATQTAIADTGKQVITLSAADYPVYDWEIAELGDGEYEVMLTAFDEAGNETTITETVLLDRSVPSQALLTVSNSPEKELRNSISNSGFEQGLDQWQLTGQVSTTSSWNQVTPFSGSSMVLLTPEDMADSTITQIIDNSGLGLRSLSFWLAVGTEESASGFDEPAFSVLVNDQTLFKLTSEEIRLLTEQQSEIWKLVSLNISEFKTDQLRITFKASNTGDEKNSPVLLIDEVRTDSTIVNSQAKFTISSSDLTSSVWYRYSVENRFIEAQDPDHVSFSLTHQPDNNLISYGSRTQSEIERTQTAFIVLDNQAPATISDLNVYAEGNQTFSLKFTAPADSQNLTVSRYEVRYSDQPITASTQWSSLPIATISKQFGAPDLSGQTEELQINIPDLERPYIALKSVDAAGNWSFYATEQTFSPQVLPIELDESNTLLITEVMANPLGSDNQNNNFEWIELFNPTDQEIDVAHWWFSDESGKRIVITDQNSDADLNEETGETVIKPGQLLTVINTGPAILNNDGDSVTLFTDSGISQTTLTYSKTTDGNSVGVFQGKLLDKLIATPGRENAQTIADLKPQAKLWWQEAFNAKIAIIDAQAYDSAEYWLVYDHSSYGTPIQEAVTGEVQITSSFVTKDHLYLASCSTLGTCIPHEILQAGSMSLKVILKGKSGSLELSVPLTGEWKE